MKGIKDQIASHLKKVKTVRGGLKRLSELTGQRQDTWGTWTKGTHVPTDESLDTFINGVKTFWKERKEREEKLAQDFKQIEELC